jgi:hypothetical protein
VRSPPRPCAENYPIRTSSTQPCAGRPSRAAREPGRRAHRLQVRGGGHGRRRVVPRGAQTLPASHMHDYDLAIAQQCSRARELVRADPAPTTRSSSYTPITSPHTRQDKRPDIQRSPSAARAWNSSVLPRSAKRIFTETPANVPATARAQCRSDPRKAGAGWQPPVGPPSLRADAPVCRELDGNPPATLGQHRSPRVPLSSRQRASRAPLELAFQAARRGSWVGRCC